jgi:hypothetical protein
VYALKAGVACVRLKRSGRFLLARSQQEVLMHALLKRPSAFVPVAMSVAALATVVSYAVMFGTARQTDEGTAAHVWQLLMVGQVPIVAFFAIRWFPSERGRATLVLLIQAGAALAAMLPVWWLGW